MAPPAPQPRPSAEHPRTALERARHDTPSSTTYECLLCASHWTYGEIQNTGRCPACGGGLLRDLFLPRRA